MYMRAIARARVRARARDARARRRTRRDASSVDPSRRRRIGTGIDSNASIAPLAVRSVRVAPNDMNTCTLVSGGSARVA